MTKIKSKFSLRSVLIYFRLMIYLLWTMFPGTNQYNATVNKLFPQGNYDPNQIWTKKIQKTQNLV